jgi:hypothetical protein
MRRCLLPDRRMYRWCCMVPAMPRASKPTIVDRLNNIRNVADDLGREFLRLQCPPRNAVHEMVAFIQMEAVAALAALKKRQR